MNGTISSTAAARPGAERAARLLVVGLVAGLLLAVLAARQWGPSAQGVELLARMPEAGGWSNTTLQATAGEPLRLRLSSADVVHGFAIGHSDLEPVDIQPGEVVETTLVFDQPGTYTFYCTRWCGVNHWRMRGTIEVSGDSQGGEQEASEPPLYVRLGLDLDAPHHVHVIPEQKPSAQRGAAYAAILHGNPGWGEAYQTQSPYAVWSGLREAPATRGLSDQQVWDLTAHLWRANISAEALDMGRKLYADNCAACHGEAGGGDGPMAERVAADFAPLPGHSSSGPPDFTDPGSMLGASTALLEGKIVRGGMGTGMPYWGPVLTDEQVRAVAAYLWTFPMELEVEQ